CPVVIKQAEDMLKKAEAKPNADTKPLIDESKKYLAEARAHHENAKTKRDHGEAVRKAKFALALAEDEVTLQTPSRQFSGSGPGRGPPDTAAARRTCGPRRSARAAASGGR